MRKRKPPKISVITPSYNQGEFLERTVQSVLNQQYPNLEYIIIDGGSTDNSLSIIKKYQRELFYWVSEKDKGQANAINKGFKRATGDIQCWLNSDDIHFPWTLHLVSNFFSKYPQIDWISGQAVSINVNDVIVKTGIHTGKVTSLLKGGFYHGKGLGFIPQEGTFWKKSLWEKSGGCNENKQFAMDYFLWKKFAQFSSLVTVEAPLAAFRITPSQKTQNMSRYYDEIHPYLKFLPQKVTLPARVFHPLFLRRFSSRIYFNEHDFDWKFCSGF